LLLLFDAGLSIEKVALVTGHKDWRMLQRYANLKPKDLHKLQTVPQLSIDEFIETLAAFLRTSNCESANRGLQSNVM
jgi:hypothetical protein